MRPSGAALIGPSLGWLPLGAFRAAFHSPSPLSLERYHSVPSCHAARSSDQLPASTPDTILSFVSTFFKIWLSTPTIFHGDRLFFLGSLLGFLSHYLSHHFVIFPAPPSFASSHSRFYDAILCVFVFENVIFLQIIFPPSISAPLEFMSRVLRIRFASLCEKAGGSLSLSIFNSFQMRSRIRRPLFFKD